MVNLVTHVTLANILSFMMRQVSIPLLLLASSFDPGGKKLLIFTKIPQAKVENTFDIYSNTSCKCGKHLQSRIFAKMSLQLLQLKPKEGENSKFKQIKKSRRLPT